MNKTKYESAIEDAMVDAATILGMQGRRIASLELENAELRAVADAAALCTIDLDSNLGSAHAEYMSGKIALGAFHYVLERHNAMYVALEKAGYTGKHMYLGIPVRPDEAEIKESV